MIFRFFCPQVQWLLANPIDELGVELSFSDPLGPEESPSAPWTWREQRREPQVMSPSYVPPGVVKTGANYPIHPQNQQKMDGINYSNYSINHQE